MTVIAVVGAPRDRHAELIAALEEYALIAPLQSEALRRLAWFLGDKGEQEAAIAIMKHASVPGVTYVWTPWGPVRSN